MTVERVLLAEPRGFCAGVEMAIKALTWMTRIFDGPVYCFHEIVHNEWVSPLRESAWYSSTIPKEGALVMLSAHGLPEVVAGKPPGGGH
jgi:4-hydroxy-3-methylbut-2-enyl diphosphate reductase